ncbi:MAG TPA: hypothetical protein PKW17_04860 [Smithellaceae bacterium]|nr:hypothetical protein [Smithellaceae bacterium]HRS89170.1 hypothetical protein [Smithellaceae bacterium]
MISFTLWFLRKKTEITVDKAGKANQNQKRRGKKGHDKLQGILQLKRSGHDVDAVNEQNYGGNQNSDIFKPDKIYCHIIYPLLSFPRRLRSPAYAGGIQVFCLNKLVIIYIWLTFLLLSLRAKRSNLSFCRIAVFTWAVLR